MNDERIFDLAMKVIARQATEKERAELDARLARKPDLRAEFERLQADGRAAKDVRSLRLMGRSPSTTRCPKHPNARHQRKSQRSNFIV